MSSKVLSISAALLFSTGIASAEVPKVSADIAPVHSLVSKVMNGLGKPHLIIPAEASPHEYQLRPSDAEAIQESKLIFWIGEDLTPWLTKSLSTLPKDAAITTLLDADGIELLDFREGALFEAHDHSDHDDHDDHDKHKKKDDHDDHDDHDHGKHKKKDEHDDHDDHEHGKQKKKDDHEDHEEHADGHDDHDEHEGHDDHGHHHGEHDIHFWLDPEIAKTIVSIASEELSEIDPANKSIYSSNAANAINDLDQLIDNTRSKINSDATYIVFHDAYQYFEQRFGIEVIGALTVNPEVLPGAKQLAEIREVIEHESVNCLFSEPQFNPSIAETIASDTGIKSAVLDPLGAELEPGKDLYFDLIGDMASSFENC